MFILFRFWYFGVSFSLVTGFLRGSGRFGGEGIWVLVRQMSWLGFFLVVVFLVIGIIGVCGREFFWGIRLLLVVFFF